MNSFCSPDMNLAALALADAFAAGEWTDYAAIRNTTDPDELVAALTGLLVSAQTSLACGWGFTTRAIVSEVLRAAFIDQAAAS
jgi:hypothetical protein